MIRGDLTPQCAAMVQAVLDALSAPQGGGDLRTRPQRYHDALAEAMKRLLASDLLPARAGQPARALVHVHFAELVEMDRGSVLQDKWIAEYRARWAAQRAAASVSPGDGGAWLEGDTARAMACDAVIIPVVTGDLDPAAVEELIGLCVQYERVRSHAPGRTGATQTSTGGQVGTQSPGAVNGQAGPDAGGSTIVPAAPGGPGGAGPQAATGTGASTNIPAGLCVTAQPAEQAAAAGRADQVLAMLEHQILAKVLQVVSGPGGVASFLRRNLLGKGLNGPSLPPSRRRADRRHPGPPAPPGGAAGPDVPVPRRLRPARGRVRAAPRRPPDRRRPDQPHEP